MVYDVLKVVNSNGVKRLHRRVETSVLKYSTLERRGLGVAKVSKVTETSQGVNPTELGHCVLYISHHKIVYSSFSNILSSFFNKVSIYDKYNHIFSNISV